MNEADRLAAAKAQQASRASNDSATTAADAERRRRAQIVASAQASIPIVMAKLAEAKFPGVRQVEVWEPRRFGKPKPTKVGGWELCQVESRNYGELASFPVYLLSDGRLYHYGSAKRPEDVIVRDHDTKRNQDSHVRDLDLIAEELRKLASGERPLPHD
ncbi:MAG TPA: hypothetical protein PK020_04080 [Ilumatobacteraceae bacterium]|nr:hypothetical protein [Ilumatobacteraceae bacterium]